VARRLLLRLDAGLLVGVGGALRGEAASEAPRRIATSPLLAIAWRYRVTGHHTRQAALAAKSRLN